MDAFKVHRELIKDYRNFTEGFVDVRDERIRASVEHETARGAQWPDPWLSLNPAFASGGTVSQLIREGSLHPDTERIFTISKGTDNAHPITFHRHQTDAIRTARSGDSYVLTTGTGSGKSLAYIVPIVDHVLRRGSRRGIQAIVVYPMNALANSQREELAKFLTEGFGEGNEPVTFARYTGQESDDEREQLLADPPDILLTNYVMLELLLTRPKERERLIAAAEGLQFLVLDELHTYRGRQGADVALLVRRVRQATGAGDDLQCVGTSATMATADTVAEQREEVAKVASTIFGTEIRAQNVITETLVRATTSREPGKDALARAVDARGTAEALDPALESGYIALADDPLAAWIESEFGLTEETGTGILVRSAPQTVEGAAKRLAELTDRPELNCQTAIRATLLAGSRQRHPEHHRPLFAFRLHQFISKGASVYVTAEPEESRAIEHEYQVVVPSSDDMGKDRRLFPLAFCRECGQEYLMARWDERAQGFRARTELGVSGDEDGYLYISTDNPWPEDPIDRLPATWLEEGRTGTKVKYSRRKRVPYNYFVDVEGGAVRAEGADRFAGGDAEPSTLTTWIPGGFQFCLRCHVTYNQARSSELAKLATLDLEGRSSAMTVLSTSIVRSLDADEELDEEVRKLLTFVDNRQDASLQAGHVNDFALVGQLRAAIYAAALEAGDEGLDPLEFPRTIPRALNLEPQHFAQNPNSFDLGPAESALRQVVTLRAMLDLRRGWRVTLPNLEQTGLIRVEYPTAKRFADSEEHWADAHALLADAAPDVRYEIMGVFFDELRRALAIDSDEFDYEHLSILRRRSREHLTGVWALSDGEQVDGQGMAILGRAPENAPRDTLPFSGRGAYARWLAQRFSDSVKLSPTDLDELLSSLFTILEQNGFLAPAKVRGFTGYRLKVHHVRLHAAGGQAGASDPVRRTHDRERAPRVIPFFRDLYKAAGRELAGLVAREHTAQVPADIREEREQDFRTGELKLLYCSPTMELGVDIASLNTVGMRNVPPTPANYAQRSGRAGRSGQPALVVTYCASGNAHDSYYFQRSDQMVAGRVQPPRLDLANEDLIRSHVHAIWLANTPVTLGKSMKEVLDLEDPAYPVNERLADAFADPDLPERAKSAARQVLLPLAHILESSGWWSEEWLEDVIARAPQTFHEKCERWRQLDQTTVQERELAYQQSSNASVPKTEREAADNRMREASRQRSLLLNEGDGYGQGDFYPYRYFAAEGFLPGYSFPRLPLAAYIPGIRGAGTTWLQRPRFLALREFGPHALIYHEGARYQVVRINLQRGGSETGSGNAGNVTLTQMRVCAACDTHHDRTAGVDVCENCGNALEDLTSNLLPLQTVITRRRDRISADEEERQRAGFDMHTSYRFIPSGTNPGYVKAQTIHRGVPILEVTYGSGAELRVTNYGHKIRGSETAPGFWLDTLEGTWLSERKARDLDEEDIPLAENVRRKERVVPFVEDRRNIAILRWSEKVTETEARSLQYAIERGIEAHYQLEDSELTSQPVKDPDERGRFMLIEAAEGGAGVLRRLHDEPDALAHVARAALEIIHVDPDTGESTSEACVRGCYRCLLTYSNQSDHESIDRRVAITTLRWLAGSRTEPEREVEAPEDVPHSALEDQVAKFAELRDFLRARNLRLPVSTDVEIEGVHVDWQYSTAVVVDAANEDHHMLSFAGWNVIPLSEDEDIEALVRANPSVFGEVD